MTFYESNTEVTPTGAEIDEFIDAPVAEPAPPPPAATDAPGVGDSDRDGDGSAEEDPTLEASRARRDNLPGSQAPPP